MIETRIDPITGIRMHEVSGELTFDELYEALQARYSDPEFQPDWNVLWDMREAVLTGFSASEVRRVVDLVEKHWGTVPGMKAALVVARAADFGMARMYEQQLASRSQSEVRVFRDLDDAMAWLKEEREPS